MIERRAIIVFVLGLLAFLCVPVLASCFDSDEIPDETGTGTGTESETG